jgi:hypothetical protein
VGLVFKCPRGCADRQIVGTVSAPIRVVALVGLLAALAMGAWMMTAGRSDAGADEPIEELRPVRRAESVATKLSGHNLATAVGKPAATKPVATPAAKPVEKPVASKPQLADGTPRTIAGVLATSRVAVVLLYDSESKVDEYSVSEAVLGAKSAGAGFFRVDVRNEKLATTFTKAYGVLQAPSVLVFRRPGTLALKLNGFVDHQTVEQAVLNVANGATPASR